MAISAASEGISIIRREEPHSSDVPGIYADLSQAHASSHCAGTIFSWHGNGASGIHPSSEAEQVDRRSRSLGPGNAKLSRILRARNRRVPHLLNAPARGRPCLPMGKSETVSGPVATAEQRLKNGLAARNR